MYKAYCYRYEYDYEDMVLEHKKLVESYPNTSLSDDALAEVCVYYLLTKHDYEKAREIFREIIAKYPDTNQ